MTKSRSSFLIAFSMLLVATMLFCIPGTKFPKIGGWQNKIMLDKWIHVFLFAMLVMTWCRYYALRSVQPANIKKTFLIITILGIFYGVTIEVIQEYFIIFRSFEIPDILADAAGAMTGYFISIKKYLRK